MSAVTSLSAARRWRSTPCVAPDGGPRSLPMWPPAQIGEERIAAAFAGARRRGRRAALMPFVMGGFPTLAASREIGMACARAGADLVELGIPCADPVADGPVIRSAGADALRAGSTVDGVLDVARSLSAHIPVVVMCYAQTVLDRGVERFATSLADAGVSGLIVPDMPPEHSAALRAACGAAGVALVPVIAAELSDDRAARLAARARGFVYAVSTSGRTGERATLAGGASALVRRAAAHARVPVALGFGISTPEHAAQAARAGAEGVIVGSRLVRAAAEAADPAATVGALVAELSAALAAAPRNGRGNRAFGPEPAERVAA